MDGEWRVALLGDEGGRPMLHGGADWTIREGLSLAATWDYEAAPSGKIQSPWWESIDGAGMGTGDHTATLSLSWEM
jgi:hypothetical protein